MSSKPIAPHLRRILNNNEPTQGPELYKTIEHRQSCATLAQLRTGHCGLNHYLARFKKTDNAKCPHCEHEKETVEHYIMECEQYKEERETLIRTVGLINMRLAYLLGNKEGVQATLKFVKETGRLQEEQGK